MRLRSNGTLQLSPSDLSSHLACPHLTTLDLRAARGELAKPTLDSPHRDLIFRKGNEHEAAYLARLIADGRSLTRIPTYDDEGFDATEARRLTEEAIAARAADVIYQPYLVSEDERWRGFADFLELQPDGTYEPVDTKLARSAKPAHVLQLLFYAEQVARLQGSPVERVHVENGLGERETFRVEEYAAYHRRVRERFLAALGVGAEDAGQASPAPTVGEGDAAAGTGRASPAVADARTDADGPVERGEAEATPPATYPWPCGHCGICDWRHLCWQQRVDDDHLSLVAGMRRSYAERLMAGGVTTLEALGEMRAGEAPPLRDGDGVISPEAFENVRHQAELQLRGRREGRCLHELLPDQEERGFRLLPEPNEGDVWFDMEGHPFYEPARGLEYLFGFCHREHGEVVYSAVWARDRASERTAFERFVDWVVERRRRYPGMHVYHYASYERSALTRLMGEHGTREQEVDGFLREEVLVDLYRVVKQALRASTDSYSIKAIEKLYGFERTAEVTGGDDSVVRFEEWVETGEDAILAEVELYNAEDCRSTYELHRWLLSIRPGSLPWRPRPDGRERTEIAEERDEERAALGERLLEGAEEGEPRRLLAHLIDYHQREQRPQWWEWFRWPQLDDDELIRDRTALGGLEWDGRPPEVEARSHVYTLTFPAQEHKIENEGWSPDPKDESGKRASFRVRVDDDSGVVTLKRGTGRVDEPLPRGLTPGQPLEDWVKREALLRFVRAYVAESEDADGASPAPAQTRELGTGDAPREEWASEAGRAGLAGPARSPDLVGAGLDRPAVPSGAGPGRPAYPVAVALLERRPPDVNLDLDPVGAALSLGESYLFVQGPPGSGKTWQGAKMAVALMRAGKRVGVTSLSHKAIHNLLRAIQDEADRQGYTFSGVKRARDEDDSETEFTSRCIVSSTDTDACADPAFDLVAGTGWSLTREAVDLHAAERPIDVLFVDEAGQLSLADVLASATSARSLVLLGDPNQLPQVSQGSHPEGSGVSVLQHLLGDHETVPPDRGLFLAETWRLRPELCSFTSNAYYEGRLGYAADAARRSLAAGNGPAWIPVDHEQRGQSAIEEADAIVAAVEQLLGSPLTDRHGDTRPLAESDVLVVAPYNAQVRMLRSRLPAGVAVGTVDRFQGQQAPVVFVSMASSTAEDAPRGVGFAFDPNRFNVATSRAQCRAVLVCAPALLDVDCTTIEQMRLVSAVCRFVELTG